MTDEPSPIECWFVLDLCGRYHKLMLSQKNNRTYVLYNIWHIFRYSFGQHKLMIRPIINQHKSNTQDCGHQSTLYPVNFIAECFHSWTIDIISALTSALSWLYKLATCMNFWLQCDTKKTHWSRFFYWIELWIE